MSVAQIINLQAAQGRAQELLTLLQGARDFAMTVEGCEAYDVYQGYDDPHTFVMVERWASIEAHQTHFEKNVKASGTFDSAVALMASPPEQTYYLLR